MTARSWQPFQLNLPRTPVTDMLIYRDDLILTTQGRGFYILDNLAIPRAIPSPTAQGTAAMLFKPEDAYRSARQSPTFYYWFRDAPTAPVTVEVTDAQKAHRFHDHRAGWHGRRGGTGGWRWGRPWRRARCGGRRW